uniref:Uncharacterized protein n=1 Tax=Romanomermis culicivorax TaxID=13658 RepID=A0A915JWC4_ROMCU
MYLQDNGKMYIYVWFRSSNYGFLHLALTVGESMTPCSKLGHNLRKTKRTAQKARAQDNIEQKGDHLDFTSCTTHNFFVSKANKNKNVCNSQTQALTLLLFNPETVVHYKSDVTSSECGTGGTPTNTPPASFKKSTSLKLLDDSIKLGLIADKALDTEAVSDNDSDRAKTPGGELDDDGDKSVASDSYTISNKSFSSTRKCRCSSSHGSSVIDDTQQNDAPASNDPQGFHIIHDLVENA